MQPCVLDTNGDCRKLSHNFPGAYACLLIGCKYASRVIRVVCEGECALLSGTAQK